MRKNALAMKRSTVHLKDILQNVMEDLSRQKSRAEDAFVKSLPGERHGGYSHIADADPPDRVSERKALDYGLLIMKYQAAIGRLNRGTFGKCIEDECDEEIPAEDLLKDPTEARCPDCRETFLEEEEKKSKIARFRGGFRHRK